MKKALLRQLIHMQRVMTRKGEEQKIRETRQVVKSYLPISPDKGPLVILKKKKQKQILLLNHQKYILFHRRKLVQITEYNHGSCLPGLEHWILEYKSKGTTYPTFG